jgi:hypothetical protein
MDDEFDKLMKLLSEDAEEKEKKLEEIFQGCTAFFDRYNEVLSGGSKEEKNAIMEKMSVLREKIKDENEKSQKRMGLSPDDVKKLAQEEKNFTPEQWEFLQEAQKKLFKEKEECRKLLSEDKERREMELKAKMKKKAMGRKSKWIKS